MVQCKNCGKETQNILFCGYHCSAMYREQNKSPEMKQTLAKNHSLKMKKLYDEHPEKREQISIKMLQVNKLHPEIGLEHSEKMKNGFETGKYKPNSGCFKLGNKINIGNQYFKNHKHTEKTMQKMKESAIIRNKRWKENGYFDIMVKRQTKVLNEYIQEHPEHCRKIGSLGLSKLGKKNETHIEKRVREKLEENGIGYVPQEVINFGDKTWCIIDFEIPFKKLIVECDGENWHQDKKKDILREQKILSQPEYSDYKILRFSGKEIKNDVDSCIQKIKNIGEGD